MLFTTFYFSGTGNTRWAVEQFNCILNENSLQFKAYSIDNFKSKSKEELTALLKKSAYIGLAHPIYGADVPPIMRDFIFLLTDILRTEQMSPIPLYIINTFGYINAFGPFAAQKLLDNQYFDMRAYCNIKLCNNVSTYSHKTTPISEEKLSTRKQAAVVELRKLIPRLLSGKKYIKGIGFYLLPGIIIRRISKQSMKNHYKTLSVQTSTCTRCMLCVRGCPTQSISYIDGDFLFSSKCTACMRCYNLCPTASVLIDGIFTDPQDYFRYKGPEKA